MRLVICALAGAVLLGHANVGSWQHSRVPPPAEDRAEYICPMHPDVRGRAGDVCRKCGMRLVAAPADYTTFPIDFDLLPPALQPNQKARVRFFVRNPTTGAVVRRFETVHERVFHLFVVGRDLDYFAHVHPVLRRDGALDVDIAVPRPGAYQLIADFLPEGGGPQLVQRAFVTAGFTGLLGTVPAIAQDLGDKTDGNLRVHLTPPDPRARREQLLTFELRDPITGAPIEDLEPFLGAAGHLLVVSDDFGAVFHSHPVAAVSSDRGPTIVFQLLFPQAGMYRLWAQFQRAGRVATTSFSVNVQPVD